MKPTVEMCLIQCSENKDFCEQFAAAIQSGYAIQSSGMATEKWNRFGVDNERPIWWAICAKVTNAKS